MSHCRDCGMLTFTRTGVCKYCDPSPDLFERLEKMIHCLDGLGPEDADALIEALRIEKRLHSGPTTRASARMILEAWGNWWG